MLTSTPTGCPIVDGRLPLMLTLPLLALLLLLLLPLPLLLLLLLLLRGRALTPFAPFVEWPARAEPLRCAWW